MLGKGMRLVVRAWCPLEDPPILSLINNTETALEFIVIQNLFCFQNDRIFFQCLLSLHLHVSITPMVSHVRMGYVHVCICVYMYKVSMLGKKHAWKIDRATTKMSADHKQYVNQVCNEYI